MKKLNIRILSAILAIIVFVTNCPVVTSANEGFSITCDGDEVTQVEFYKNEKLEVSADNLLAGASRQWQIQIPGTDTWIDIYGQTGHKLKLSYALLGSLLNAEHSATVRCAAISDGEAVAYTEELVAIVNERPTTVRKTTSEDLRISKKLGVNKETIEEEVIEEVIEEEVIEEEVIEEVIEEEIIEEEVIDEEETIEEEIIDEEEIIEEEVIDEEETIEEEVIEEETIDEEVIIEEKIIEEETIEAEAIEEVTIETVEEVLPAEPEQNGVIERTEAESMMFAMPRSINWVSAKRDASAIDENTKIVSVTIEYYYEDREGRQGDMAMDPYIARIPEGKPLNVSVPCKVFPGYEIVLVNPVLDGVILDDNEISVNLNSVTEDQTIVVHYREIQVPYYARYFMQNVYNDLYTERADVLTEEQKELMIGFAGEQPDEALVYPDVTGFSPLFYQPDRIAADASTVFEVYYDRNYHLINFDLDGGFGPLPVYARYETSFTVSNPVKPGYEFAGWELTSYDTKTDGTNEENAAYNATLAEFLANAEKDSNGLIKKIPYTNLTYTAKWRPLETTYTVAYWLRQETGDKVTELFLGNRIVSANADATVNGQNDLRSDMLLCGLGMHDHTQSCYSIPNHTHSNGCVDVSKLTKENTQNNNQDYSAITDIGNPESGYLYTIHVENYSDPNTYYKLYLEGQWYSVDSSYLSGVSLGEGRYDTGWAYNNGKTSVWVANKYYAKLPCGYGSVVSCGNHEHSTSCYQNARNLQFVEADQNVTVKGDGSTVVNVYYEYKEYTLKFYYAATTGGTDSDHNGKIDANEYESVKIVGGSTTHFGYQYNENTDDDLTLLRNMAAQSGQWGLVDELPQLNTEGAKRNYEKGTLVDDKNTPNTSDDISYHYISFKAHYGDDISDMWPCGVFESVSRTNKNTTSPSNGWSGTEAFASAWNGEHHVKYSRNGNQTIKGIYEKLDAEILFHPDYADSQEVSYLCFWENGADNIKWNAPELYIYNVWLPFQGTDEEFENLPDDQKRINPNNQKKYWLYRSFNTCDDSKISEQTGIAITGYKEEVGYRAWSVYFISQARYGKMGTEPRNSFYVVSNNNERKYKRAEDWETAIGTVYSDDFSYNVNMTVRDYSDVTKIVDNPNTNGKYLLHTDQYDPTNPGEVINHTLYREAYSVDFYYKSNEHRIYYRNYNKNMGSGEGALVSYGKDLGVYGKYYTKAVMEADYYPDVLEPNAYEFMGWCTSADCLEGTEMDWSGKMPDSDVTVYAKWVPKTYNVKFYLDYDRLQAGTDVWYEKTDASHGEPMKNLDQGKILPTGKYVDANGKAKEYRFVGWFYINENGEKEAFNPSEMEVRQNLELYAEWSTTIVKEYTISYKLGKLSADGKSILPINQGEEGYRVLGETTTGYAFEATTRTFAAKPEEQLNNLTPEEKGQSIWVPHTNSHSILMKAENEDNVFTFWYVPQSNIPYTVRYLDASTNEPVIFNEDGTEYKKIQDPNKESVVTEQFVYVPGYVPDSFHKTLILSFNPDENIIVFYYTKDDNYEEDGDDDDDDPDKQSARYLITHYIQDVNSDPEVDPETYSVYTTDDLIGIVGENVSAGALDISGFTFNQVKTESEKGNNTVKSIDGKWYVEGTVTTGETASDALQLKFYYSRNKYSYTVKYLNADTLQNVHEPKKTDAEYYFDSVVEEKALDNIKGYELYGSEEQTLKISALEDLNVITFLYTPKSFTVNYVPVCENPDLTGGYVLTTAEYGNTINGTSAVAYDGFKFVGWYSDEECNQIVGTEAFYKPNVSVDDDIYEYTFYALFEPITLTITQENMRYETDSGIYEIMNSSDQVIATVMITGNSSVTLGQIPEGTYRVREITSDWTWTYDVADVAEVVVDRDKIVTVKPKAKWVDWLHAENR